MKHRIVVTFPSKSAQQYPIMIGANIYDVNSWLPKNKKYSRIVIITDHNIKKRYGLLLQKKLKQTKRVSLVISFPAGEKYKTNKTKELIENKLLLHQCDRDTLIVALGGGVVGDVAGFVSATYMRGIDYIQMPTTLLAMVDSSVGGKTAVNTPYAKNAIGVIYQPKCVAIDIHFLKTLSKKQRINGLIEAIKMFLTHDAKSFRYVQLHLDSIINGDESSLAEVVTRAVRIKAGVVSRDENESNERGVLNFGHTIGHALEALSHYKLPHGYAVAYGVLVEATISHVLGLLSIKSLAIIKNLLGNLGFKGQYLQHFDVSNLIAATKQDKKTRLNKPHYVVLKEVGSVSVVKGKFVHPVSDTIVKQSINSLIKG